MTYDERIESYLRIFTEMKVPYYISLLIPDVYEDLYLEGNEFLTNKEIEKKQILDNYKKIINPTEEILQEKFNKYITNLYNNKWKQKILLNFSPYINIIKDSYNLKFYTCSIQVDSFETFFQKDPHYSFLTSTNCQLAKFEKSYTQIKAEYAQNVCSLAFICAVILFNICPSINEVFVNAWIDNKNDTELNNKKIIYDVIVPKELVKMYDLENLNAVEAILSLKGNVDIRRETEIHFVNPLI